MLNYYKFIIIILYVKHYLRPYYATTSVRFISSF